MRWLQRLLTRGRPGTSIEAESRAWVHRCKCGHETSIWDMGGIRWKAFGRPYRLWRCQGCGKLAWGRLHKKPLVS